MRKNLEIKKPVLGLLLACLFTTSAIWIQADNERPEGPFTDGGSNNPGNKDPNKSPCAGGSNINLEDGNLSVAYTLPSYRSLGVARGLRFVYNSTTADVRPILTTEVGCCGFINDMRPTTLSALLNVAGQQPGDEVFYDTRTLPSKFSSSRLALQFDANDLATGSYLYSLGAFSNYTMGRRFGDMISGRVLINNQRNSPFGAGWGLADLQKLTLRPNNSAILTEGDGTIKTFSLRTDLPLFNSRRDFPAGSSPMCDDERIDPGCRSSIATGDFNRDGIKDIAVTNQLGNAISILLGDGRGGFMPPRTVAVGQMPVSIVVSDFNADNNPDLAVANFTLTGPGSVSILLGNGDGTFRVAPPLRVGEHPLVVATGDLNNDDVADLAVANRDSNTISIFLGNGDGTFRQVDDIRFMGRSPIYITLGDFNNDNKLDIAVTYRNSRIVSALLGNGDGTFGAPRDFDIEGSFNASFITAGDFNQDDNLDLAVLTVAPGSEVSLWLGDGQGGFRRSTRIDGFGGQPSSLMSGDFNGDNILDVAVTARNGHIISVSFGDGQGNFTAPVQFATGQNPRAVAFDDLNGDGIPDLAVANYPTNTVSILLGDDQGGFTAPINLFGTRTRGNLTPGDFNGDGNLDLAFITSNRISLALGDGRGGFRAVGDFAPGRILNGIAAGDFDSDGNLDLAVTNTDEPVARVSILRGDGQGGFQQPPCHSLVRLSPGAIITGDFNNDGKLDLALTISGFGSSNVAILLGNGDCTFQQARYIDVRLNPISIVSGDFNRDGNLDLVVANRESLTLLLGDGRGGFPERRDIPIDGNPGSLTVGDFDNDGNLDLAVTETRSGNIIIYYGDGRGGFTPRTIGGLPRVGSLVAGDFNGDGNLDLAMAFSSDTATPTNVLVLLGDGRRAFTPQPLFGAGFGQSDLIAGDFNSDGKLDLAVTSLYSLFFESRGGISFLLSFPSSPPGEYSRLVRNADGTFSRIMKDGTRINFNTQGLHVSTVDRNDNTTTYCYTTDPTYGPLLAKIIDPTSAIRDCTAPTGVVATLFTYNSGRLASVTDPAGRTTTFNVNAVGDLASITDPTRAITQYDYEDHRLTSQTNPRTFTTSYEYNFAGGFMRSLLPDEYESTRELTATQMAGLVNPFCPCNDPNCPNPSAQPQCGTRVVPAPMTLISRVQATLIDSRRNRTVFTTDRFGAITSTKDPLERETKTERDGHSNPTRITEPNRAVTRMTYDNQGNLIAATDALNNRTRYTYNARFNQITSITDPKGNRTRFEYDSRGNLFRILDALDQPTRFSYNDRGLPTSITDALRNVTGFEYNDRGNRIRIIDPLGRKTKMEYDQAGNIVSFKEAEGTSDERTTSLTYDPMNRLISVQDALEGTTEYTYEPSCPSCSGSVTLLSSIRDARGKITQFRYDEMGRLKETENPLGQIRRFKYDPTGNVTEVTNARGQRVEFEYDRAGQLKFKRLLPSRQELARYDYDETGNLKQVINPDSRLDFDYDRLGRLTESRSQGLGLRTLLKYLYDGNGNRERLEKRDPTTEVVINEVRYTYDRLNRLETLTNHLGDMTRFEYYETGLRKKVSHLAQLPEPNRILASMTYDAASQLRTLTYVRPASEPPTLASFDYSDFGPSRGYDSIGNRKTMRETDGRGGLYTHRFEYDMVNRLTEATRMPERPILPTERYGYDDVGNRLESEAPEQSSCFDDANRLVYDGTYGYVYDADGNVTVRCIADPPPAGVCSPTWQPVCQREVTRYEFDVENRLTRVTLADGRVVRFKYDGLGRRVEYDVEGGNITRYVYDNEHILEIYDRSNRLIGRYTHGLGIDEILSVEQDGQSYFYITDALGSVVKVVNRSAIERQFYIYDSFGRIMQQSGTVNQPFTYTAREWDASTNLYFYRTRYYDPAIGRFLSEDPAGLDGGLNLYPYVLNNPIIGMDPFGLKVKICRRPLQGFGGRSGGSRVRKFNPGASHVYLYTDSGGYYGFTKLGSGMGLYSPNKGVPYHYPPDYRGQWGDPLSEPDNIDTDDCRDVPNADPCVEKCINDTALGYAPNYSLKGGKKGGQSCGSWAEGSLGQCLRNCGNGCDKCQKE